MYLVTDGDSPSGSVSDETIPSLSLHFSMKSFVFPFQYWEHFYTLIVYDFQNKSSNNYSLVHSTMFVRFQILCHHLWRGYPVRVGCSRCSLIQNHFCGSFFRCRDWRDDVSGLTERTDILLMKVVVRILSRKQVAPRGNPNWPRERLVPTETEDTRTDTDTTTGSVVALVTRSRVREEVSFYYRSLLL